MTTKFTQTAVLWELTQETYEHLGDGYEMFTGQHVIGRILNTYRNNCEAICADCTHQTEHTSRSAARKALIRHHTKAHQ